MGRFWGRLAGKLYVDELEVGQGFIADGVAPGSLANTYRLASSDPDLDHRFTVNPIEKIIGPFPAGYYERELYIHRAKFQSQGYQLSLDYGYSATGPWTSLLGAYIDDPEFDLASAYGMWSLVAFNGRVNLFGPGEVWFRLTWGSYEPIALPLNNVTVVLDITRVEGLAG